MTEIHWLPTAVACPYVKKLMSFTNTKLVFNGYFYLENETLPVKRILCINNNFFYTEILKKQNVDDTSKYSEIDEGRVCFFPTNIIELDFKILKKIECNKELSELYDEIIMEEHNVQERDMNFRRRKEEKELEERSEIWKIEYEKYKSRNS
jgi:hypothetical protein